LFVPACSLWKVSGWGWDFFIKKDFAFRSWPAGMKGSERKRDAAWVVGAFCPLLTWSSWHATFSTYQLDLVLCVGKQCEARPFGLHPIEECTCYFSSEWKRLDRYYVYFFYNKNSKKLGKCLFPAGF
jgi:hypothetical protein